MGKGKATKLGDKMRKRGRGIKSRSENETQNILCNLLKNTVAQPPFVISTTNLFLFIVFNIIV